jgi:hypothetical protein
MTLKANQTLHANRRPRWGFNAPGFWTLDSLPAPASGGGR